MNIYDWQSTTVNIATNSTAVTAKRAILRGIYVNTVLSAHTVLITNAAAVTKYTLPASLPAGTYIPIGDVIFDGITVDPNDAGTGNITVEYKEI